MANKRLLATEDLRKQWPQPGWYPAILVKTRVWVGCSVSGAHNTWSPSLLCRKWKTVSTNEVAKTKQHEPVKLRATSQNSFKSEILVIFPDDIDGTGLHLKNEISFFVCRLLTETIRCYHDVRLLEVIQIWEVSICRQFRRQKHNKHKPLKVKFVLKQSGPVVYLSCLENASTTFQFQMTNCSGETFTEVQNGFFLARQGYF